MSDSTIGIKIADGSYYPVLEQGFTGRKKLTLTTAKDNQQKVQIDLYRGNGSSLSEAQYIGSLVIENIPRAPQGAPEIDLIIGIDEDGQISAEACDRATGECQKFDAMAEHDVFEEPEFVMDEAPKVEPTVEEAPLTGETYPVSETDRRKERVERRRPGILLLVLFVILGLALVVAIAYFVYRSIQGPQVPDVPPSIPATTSGTPPPAATPPTTGTATTSGAAATQSQQGTGGQAAVPAAESKPAATGSVTYRIKKGDTLWDISATYYRNPWLYPKLAKANSIMNPDLIFAGTRIVIPEN